MRLLKRYAEDVPKRVSMIFATFLVVSCYLVYYVSKPSAFQSTVVSYLEGTIFHNVAQQNFDRLLGALAVLPVLLSLKNYKWAPMIVATYMVIAFFLDHYRLFDMLTMTVLIEVLLYCQDTTDFIWWFCITFGALKFNYLFPGLLEAFMSAQKYNSSAPINMSKN